MSGRRCNQRRRLARGQASVETIISAATILMFLPAVVAMFRYAEIQQWLDQVGRYVAWERSVWVDRAEEPWDTAQGVDEADRAITRSDGEIAQQALLRLGDTRRPLMEDGGPGEAQAMVEEQFEVPELVGWNRHKRSRNDPSMFAARPTPSATVARQAMTEPDRGTVMAPLANRGQELNLGILNDAMNLQLSDRNLAKVTIQVQVKDLFSEDGIDAQPLDGEEMMGNDPLGERLGGTFTMSTTTALQTNPWSPRNEDVFQDKVHNLDAKLLVEVASGMTSLGLAPAAHYAQESLDDRSKTSIDRWSGFAPFIGQINMMWPELDQDSADIPFNRVKLYDYSNIPNLDGPADAFGDYDPMFSE